MDDVVRKICDKVSEGLLPIQDPITTWAGYGTGVPCDCCDARIDATQIEHELELPGDRVLRLHASCEAMWRQFKTQRRRASDPDPPVGHG